MSLGAIAGALTIIYRLIEQKQLRGWKGQLLERIQPASPSRGTNDAILTALSRGLP